MSLNPLSTILSSNKLEGDNYVDWKRNLDIVLTIDKHKWVLTTPYPQTNEDSTQEEKDALAVVNGAHKKSSSVYLCTFDVI
jgi:hypothetical protein